VIAGLSDAELDALILKAEEVFARAVRKAFFAAARQLASNPVTAAMDPVGGMDLDDVLEARRVWSQEIPELSTHIGAAYGRSATGVAVALYEDAGINLPSQSVPAGANLAVAPGALVPRTSLPLNARLALDVRARDHLAAATNRLVNVGDGMWMDVRSELVKGFTAGEGIEDIKQRLLGQSQINQRRARTIARTEVVSASNAGAMAGARAIPELAPETKTWLATTDARTRPTHIEADGQTVPIDDMFNVGGAMMEYPGGPGPAAEVINCRCVSGVTVVEAEGVSAILRRWYAGPMVRLTTPLGELVVTPNHPVATPVGWCQADALNEGGYVLGVFRSDHQTLAVPQVDDVISSIEQVWETLNLQAVAQRMGRAEVDFYGHIPDGDVDVAATNLDLPLHVVPKPIAEQIGDHGFASAHRQVSVPGDSSRQLVISHPQHIRCRSAAGLDSGVEQDGPDHLSRMAERRGEGILALSGLVAAEDFAGDAGSPVTTRHAQSIAVAAHDSGSAHDPVHAVHRESVGPNHVFEAGSIPVHLDQVSFINDWSGHVYDLSARTGWFIANGIIVRNCTVIFSDPAPEVTRPARATRSSATAERRTRFAAAHGVSPEQLSASLPDVNVLRARVRAEAASIQADSLGWLNQADAFHIRRPRLATGSGGEYDWYKAKVSGWERNRLASRWFSDRATDAPDVVMQRAQAAGVFNGTTVDEFMDEWLYHTRRADIAGSIRSGRIPNPNRFGGMTASDVSSVLEQDGYDLLRIVGVDAEDAAGYLAAHQSEQHADRAYSLLRGATEADDPPWRMSFQAWEREVRELEEVIAEGSVGGQGTSAAAVRYSELVPEAIDRGQDFEVLYAEVVEVARVAGMDVADWAVIPWAA